MRLPPREKIDAWLKTLSPEDRREAEDALREVAEVSELNPLAIFEPLSEAQRVFMAAQTPIVAAFAGNQFGKSSCLVIRGLRECLPPGFLPKALLEGKRFGFDGPAHGWILCPSNDKIYDSLFPALRRWAPREALHKGDIDSAYDKQHRVLRFARGDTISFKTYEMEVDKLGGATLHWVGYDEPPPQLHRDEAMTRLLRHDGYEMFAMTPLKVNTGWIRRVIYKNREHPDITVVRGSIHDNPLLDQKAKTRILGAYKDDLWRAAREFGDFVEVGGLVYPEFERHIVDAPDPELVRSWEVLVGIDPGIRNAGFAFIGFDDENVATMFDEGLLQDGTVADYAALVREKLSYWGIDVDDVTFVIDPASRARSQVNAETVESALAREGIYCVHGQNDVEAGVWQIRGRMQHGRWQCSSDCRYMRDAVDDYALEDREDGEFKPVKNGREHVPDAARYVAMERPYDPTVEEEAPEQRLGWQPGRALDARLLNRPGQATSPLGAMS